MRKLRGVNDWFNRIRKLRWLWAAGAGLMLGAAFPKFGVAGLAWIAPGLLLLSTLGAGRGEIFRLGYLAGLVQALVALHWLLYIPVSIAPIAGWLALSAYLALYPAVWAWGCSILFELIGNDEWRSESFARTDGRRTALWTLVCAALWVGLEMAQGRLLTGFPWNFLGVSQYTLLPLIQISSVTGVYGVSFLVAWFSAALAVAGARLFHHPLPRWGWLSPLLFPTLLISMIWAWGMHRAWTLTHETAPAEITVALIQPSIPQTLIWDPKGNTNRFDRLMQLSELALATHPDLLVWPEAAVPDMLRYEPVIFKAVTDLVRKHGVWAIVGSDDAEPQDAKAEPGKDNYFNSSFLISPEGRLVNRYSKRHLVAFGEYVPLARWLPFLKHFTPIGDSGFTPGPKPVPFEFTLPFTSGGKDVVAPVTVRTSVLICFEDVIPHLARENAFDDADFLLNLTNDGWFGESAAQWQQAANSVFRAVENGLPLVRCANNGLTCWIDSAGQMHEVYFGDSKDIYAAGFKTAKIPVRAGAPREPTFYHQHGDWFGWGCAGLSIILLCARRFMATREAREKF